MSALFEKGLVASLGTPPRLNRRGSLHPAVVVVSVLGLAISAAVLFMCDPNRYGFYPYCTFYRATGLLCPGCGSLRALHRLLHGQVVEALRFNALLVLSLPLVVAYAVRIIVNQRSGRGHQMDIRTGWLWCGLGVLILFGVLRNLPFAQSAWLAP